MKTFFSFAQFDSTKPYNFRETCEKNVYKSDFYMKIINNKLTTQSSNNTLNTMIQRL